MSHFAELLGRESCFIKVQQRGNLENSEGVSFFSDFCFVCGCGLGERTLNLEVSVINKLGGVRWETEDPA